MLSAVVDRPAPDEAHQPIEMAGADDPAVVGALLRIIAVELEQRLFQVSQKFRGDVVEHEDIIRRGARLAGIEPAPKGDAVGGNLQVG